MDFYFTNRQFGLQEIVSTNTSTAIVMAGEEDKLSIENGSRTLTGTLYFTNKQSAQVKVCAAIGNYILYHDKNNKDVWMTIVEIEHNPLNGTHAFVAEDAGLDLLNELVGPYKADKAYNIAYYINKFTFDSGFEVGFNEISSLTRKLEWESEDSTALARALSVATQFDNAEIEFSFAVEGTNVLKKYINIYKKRGKDNRQTLYVNVDVNNIVVKSDIYDLGTSIYATGGTPDGKNSPINLKGYKYTDPKGRFVLGADGVMRDTESVQLWSRLLSVDNPNPKSSHIQRLKRYETTNKKTLCDSVVRELEKISKPLINYEVDIADLPEGVNIGDTIYLVDENEEVYLSARVLELSFMYSTDSYVATLGDYLIKQSGVSQSLNELANDLREQANRKKYDVKLEATAQAFVDKKGTITIVAKVFDGTLDVSTNFSEYKWSRIDSEGIADPDWTNITNTVTISADDQPLWTYICEVSNLLEDGTKYLIGTDRLTIVNLENGEIGEPGAPGDAGKTSYFHTAWADDENGTNFSTTDSIDRTWLGTYSDFEPLDSSDYRKYAWSKVKGEKGDQGVQGLQGPQGNQGIAGPKGVDGKTQYTHIAYANSADGIVDFSVSDSDREYIGVYVDFTATDSTTPSDYAWTLVKGADGTSGTPGKAGTDGKTPYFHVAYATNATGTAGFSTTVSDGKTYIGQYTDYVSTDSTDPTKYKWTKIVGPQGAQGPKGDPGNQGIPGTPGADGRTPYTHWAYAWSADGTDRFTPVYPGENIFNHLAYYPVNLIWNRELGCYEAITQNIAFAMFDVGKMITDLSKTYTMSFEIEALNDTIQFKNSIFYLNPTTSVQHNKPILIKDKKVKVFATFKLTTTSNTLLHTYYNESPQGAFRIYNVKVEEGNTPTIYTTPPSDDPINAYPTYTGTYTDYTEADSTSPADYTWVRTLGEAGHDGKDGIAGKDGVGIKSTAITYAASTSGTIAPTTGWTETVPTVAAGSFLWTKTTWTYTDNSTETGYSVAKMGNNGATGPQGPQGDPTGVTESATVPANPYSGMLWKCTGTLAGYQQNTVYRWNGSKWEIWTFSAVNIIAETFNGLTFTGVTIKASEFISSYNIETSGKSYKGELSISTGMYINDYESDNAQGRFTITRIGDIVNGRSYAGASQQYELTPRGLGLRDGDFNGILTAQALTKTNWENLNYAAGYTTAENNPCQFKIVYQLDGTRLIRFRGQFKKTSGNLANGGFYPFANIPTIITPNRTEFGYLPTASDGTMGNTGGRIAITATPLSIVCHLTDSHQVYGAISGLSYIIE